MTRLTPAAVAEFHRTLSNWGRWGERDQRGTLNWLTRDHARDAAHGVRNGRTASCARALDTEAAPDNRLPAVHLMMGTATEGWGGDYFALAPHGYATSHLDALCHIFHEGRLYNGYPIERVTAHGAQELAVDALADGIVGRGVLLDVPRSQAVPYVPAGEPIHPEDLDRAEAAAGVRIGEGDLLLVRTGRWVERAERGPWDPHERMAGLHATCLPWLHERRVALLGCDGVSDVVPSGVDEVRLPIHTVGIVAMGLTLLDNLDLDALAQVCREEERSEFLLTIAPLRIRGGTASPVNPIAVF